MKTSSAGLAAEQRECDTLRWPTPLRRAAYVRTLPSVRVRRHSRGQAKPRDAGCKAPFYAAQRTPLERSGRLPTKVGDYFRKRRSVRGSPIRPRDAPFHRAASHVLIAPQAPSAKAPDCVPQSAYSDAPRPKIAPKSHTPCASAAPPPYNNRYFRVGGHTVRPSQQYSLTPQPWSGPVQ
jgi:hypothetical protein